MNIRIEKLLELIKINVKIDIEKKPKKVIKII